MSVPPTSADDSLRVRLSGRRLLLARVVWILVAALAVGLFVVGIPAEFALLHIPCPTETCPTGQLSPSGLRALEGLGLSLDSFAVYAVAMDVIFAAVCTAVSLLIFWRRSDDRMGLLVSLALLTFGTADLRVHHGGARGPAPDLGGADLPPPLPRRGLLRPLPLPLPGRTVRAPLDTLGGIGLDSLAVAQVFLSRLVFEPGRVHLAHPINTAVWLGALGTAIYSQGYRYRRTASSAQRQQIKWVVCGISAALTVFIGVSLTLGVFAPKPTSLGALLVYLIDATLIGYLAILLIPVSIGVAILRHHLFDIDLIINRTLVYVTLTVVLAAFFEGTIVSSSTSCAS